MTVVALDLLRAVAAAGGAIRLQGEMLRLSAPEPLPDDLRERLRQHRLEVVALLSAAQPANDAPPQTAATEVGQNLPANIADGVRAILAAEGAKGVPPNRWPQVQRDARRLVERRWLHEALSLGWTVAELFGCDQCAAWHRLDRAGLVLLVGGHEIVELTASDAALGTATGSVIRYRHRPPAKPPVALLWDLLIPAQATGPDSRSNGISD